MRPYNFATRFLGVVAAVALLAGLASPRTGSAPSASGMTAAEAEAFKEFVAYWQNEDICWKSTVTRGAGFAGDTCPPGSEKSGALCYPKCKAGFTGIGPVCQQNCPPGYRNDGLFCAKPAAYGRGGGYPWKFGDWLDSSGMFSRCERDNGGGNCEQNGAIVYPKCKPGFHNVGCCVCSPDCPAGMSDAGVSCAKQTYGRTVGFIPDCPADHEKSGLLCYPKCPAGTNGIGPVCWAGCPPGYPVDCGAACGKSSADCAVAILTQVSSTAEFALNVASFAVGAGPAAKAGITAAKAAARAVGKNILSREARAAAIAGIKRRLREEAEKEGKSMSEEALDKAATGLELAKEAGQFDWTMLDPTGVAAVVDAFNKPICGR